MGVLEFHGCPGDFSNDAENGQPWADMGWINNNSKFEFNRANDFIVDFDLSSFLSFIKEVFELRN